MNALIRTSGRNIFGILFLLPLIFFLILFFILKEAIPVEAWIMLIPSLILGVLLLYLPWFRKRFPLKSAPVSPISDEDRAKYAADVADVAYIKYKKKELARKNIEQFKSKEVGWEGILPSIVWFLAALVLVLIYLFNKQNFDATYIFYLFAALAVVGGPYLIQDEWDKEKEWKYRISSEENSLSPGTYKLPAYETDYYYTDSQIEYLFHRLGRILLIIANVLLIPIIAIILFSWLGTISIAPDTIIIILLVIIISNQMKS